MSCRLPTIGGTRKHFTPTRLYKAAAAPQPMAKNSRVVDICTSRAPDWLSVPFGA